MAEVALVALAAGGIAVGFYAQPAVPKVHVGNRTWTVAWAVPAENAAAGGEQVTNAFPDGRAHDQSLRQIAEMSLGGAAFRVRFTNEDGDAPLRLARVTVAPALGGGRVDTRRMHQLAFSGNAATQIPPGAEATSDPVPMALTTGQLLALSMAVTGTSPTPTVHQFAGRASGISPPGSGDLTRRGDGGAFTTQTTGSFWLATVEVLNPPGAVRAIAALGDSQTDAYFLTDGDSTWPQLLHRRLLPAPIAVIDSGLTGNTIVDVGCDICGAPMQQRVIRDVVNLPGVDTAIVMGGTNDISRGATAGQIVHGLASVAAILHAHAKRAILMTIPPRAPGSFGWIPSTMERIRVAVNGWIRAQTNLDGMVDADRILADPARPTLLDPRYQRGDGTHLSAAGRAALAAAIPLALVR